MTSLSSEAILTELLRASPQAAGALGRPGWIDERRRIASDVERGLTAHEFELHYQPIRDVRTAKITSFEGLLRWRHPERGLLVAGQFLPDVEGTALMVELGEVVFAHGCAQLAKWQRVFGENAPTLNLNVSARQLRERTLTDRIAAHLEVSGADPSGLCLELTETCALAQEDGELDELDLLREMGIRIALDDFGTGYSSLHNILEIDADVLKIDREFTSHLGIDERATVIVRATIEMAGAFGTSVVAEGVSTIEQYRLLREMGCHAIQGFLIAPPVPAAETEAMFRGEAPAGAEELAGGIGRIAAVLESCEQLAALDPDYRPSVEEVATMAGVLPAFACRVMASLHPGCRRSTAWPAPAWPTELGDLDLPGPRCNHDGLELRVSA